MAGRGPAPKPADQRRRRNQPARGEWVTLPELTTPILPSLPKRATGTGSWSAQTKRAWDAWRKDPATTQFGPADIQLAIDAAYLYAEFARGRISVASEIRQRLDSLGLSPKGKRDLRWRVGEPGEVIEMPRPEPKKRRLRAVD